MSNVPVLTGSKPRCESMDNDSLGIVQFGFPAKTSFDADDALLLTRSEKIVIKDKPLDDDIWKRPPPDFRVTVYDPSPPKRNTRDSMQPWLYGTIPGERTIYHREKTPLLPVIFKKSQQNDKHFVTQFRIQRPFTAKNRFVREGMYKAGTYETPEKNDFRGYPPIKKLGLPEFRSDYERDPYNINFHTRSLNTIHGLGFNCTERDLVPGRQMEPGMGRQPPYDAALILHRDPWPTKSGAFTRYRRRNRHPHSAFMERVETELVTQWAKEKMEKTLEEYGQRKKSLAA